MSSTFRVFSVFFLVLYFSLGASADDYQCGSQAGGKVCDDGLCCSSAGYCGYTDAYCGTGCQSQCHDLPSFVNETTYEEMFPHEDDANCTSQGFYSYQAFIEAVLNNFQQFASIGDDTIRKREVAAFLAQTSYATTANVSEDEVDDPYAWGYCILSELNPPSNYCNPHFSCPEEYYGRGPFQLQWNYNYQHAGEEIGVDLLNVPDLLTTDAVTSFESAYWRWMTPKSSTEPSCHDAMVGVWSATEAEIEDFKWYPGFGLTTNILNGENECGQGPTESGEKRIGFYKRYCDMLGVDYGDHLDCYDQTPLSGASLSTMVKTM